MKMKSEKNNMLVLQEPWARIQSIFEKALQAEVVVMVEKRKRMRQII